MTPSSDLWLTSLDPLTPLPSFFEMFLTSSVSKALRDSSRAHLERLLLVAEARSPAALSPVAKSLPPVSAELHLLAVSFLELRSLLSPSCSLVAESVYSLRRAEVEKTERGGVEQRPVGRRGRILAGVAECLEPYILYKLEVLYKDLLSRQPPPPSFNNPSSTSSSSSLPPSSSRNPPSTLSSLFTYLYPFLRLTHAGAGFAYRWLYLFGRTVHFSPLLHLLGQTVSASYHSALSSPFFPVSLPSPL